MGPGGRRGPVFSAQRTKQGSDCHQSDPHGHLLLFILVDSNSGSGQSSVRPAAQERNNMVSALLLGVNMNEDLGLGVSSGSGLLDLIMLFILFENTREHFVT